MESRASACTVNSRAYGTAERVKGAVDAALTAFLDPERDDAVATLGELTGETALKAIRDKMLEDETGRKIVNERWDISAESMQLERLEGFPVGSFGRSYANFLGAHGFNPDERQPVRHVSDPELAFVMQRYRQVHDFWHVLCGVEPTVVGEVALKWLEMVQTEMPVATLSAFVGPFRLPPREFRKLWTEYVPWAARCGLEARFLMNVPYEHLLERDVAELREELRVVPFDRQAYVAAVRA